MLLFVFLIANSVVATPIEVEVSLDKRPVAKQSIEMIGFVDGEQIEHQEKLTDSRGRAQFHPKAGDYHIVFRAQKDGVPYLTEPIFSRELPKKPVPIKIYESTESNSSIFIEDLRLFIASDRENLLIEEDLIIENPSNKTLKGKSTEAFRIPLPANSHDLRFVGGFTEAETRFEGNDIVSSRPMIPGTTRLALRFAVEKFIRSAEVHLKLPFPVRQISLGSPDILEISGLKINRGPDKYFGGKMITTYTADGENKTEFKLRFSNLPTKYRVSQILPFFVVFLLILVVGIFGRRGTGQTSPDTKEDLLKKLKALLILRERKLVDDDDFQRRRFRILDQLSPYYDLKD